MDDLSQQTTGDLITEEMYNAIIDRINFVLKGNTVGDIKHAMRTTDISTSGTYNWLICDGRTVGDASSGADIASATMQTLFTHLWDSGALLTMVDSSGGATTRGATALDDWNGHNRMYIPNTSGRVLMNLEHTTGFWVGSWSINIGGVFGTPTHTLSESELAVHDHGGASGASFYMTGGGSLALGGGSGVVSAANTANAGSGSAHNNTQPTYTVVHLICTGV